MHNFFLSLFQINLLFLINIVRIVVTKAHLQSSSQPETAHIKKAVRATLILFPLLGITNIIFFINPKNGTHDKLYMLFNSSMQSSQVGKKDEGETGSGRLKTREEKRIYFLETNALINACRPLPTQGGRSCP